MRINERFRPQTLADVVGQRPVALLAHPMLLIITEAVHAVDWEKTTGH